METSLQKNCLTLNLAAESGAIVQGIVREGEDDRAIRTVERIEHHETNSAELAQNIYLELDRLARDSTDNLNTLKSLGSTLWDRMLGPQAGKMLRSAGEGCLTLLLDEALVSIPWELMHDGEHFLGEKLAIGRIVRTTLPVLAPVPVRREGGWGLLILANPTGDLPGAQIEQDRIRSALRTGTVPLRLRVKAGQVSRDFVVEQLRNYDAIHFSGHARFDADSPGESGWILSDGLFTGQDLRRLAESGQRMPLLVFANACSSGRAETEVRQLSFTNSPPPFFWPGCIILSAPWPIWAIHPRPKSPHGFTRSCSRENPRQGTVPCPCRRFRPIAGGAYRWLGTCILWQSLAILFCSGPSLGGNWRERNATPKRAAVRSLWERNP